MTKTKERQKMEADVAQAVRTGNVGAALRLTRRLADERDAAQQEIREMRAGFVMR